MHPRPGIFLQSTDPNDDLFGNALVYLVEYGADGALGVIVNKPFGRALNELQEFRHSRPFALYNGGPVDGEHLYFLHRRPDFISEGTLVGDGIYWGGSFSDAVRGINNGTLSTTDVRIFVGYCGWDSGDLERELEEGSWALQSLSPDSIFTV